MNDDPNLVDDLTDDWLADKRERVEKAAQHFVSRLVSKLPSKTGAMKQNTGYSLSDDGLVATVHVPHPMQFIEFGWVHAGSQTFIPPRPIVRQTLLAEEA